MKKFLSLCLFFVFMISVTSSFFVYADGGNNDITIVFTHDLHSHVEPFLLNGSSVGGLAKIKTIIDSEKSLNSNTIVVDGGDFSMGTLFQTAFTTSAIEYRMLGLMSYDATTFGNHEFDYGFDSLEQMITVANKSDTPLPPILCSNLNAEKSGLTDDDLQRLNIQEYRLIKKDDLTIAIFGVLGEDAVELSSAGGLTFDNYIDAAKDTVEEIKKLYSPDLIICLSHSGTGDDVDDEDIKLAKKVPDIDVIISGHTHTYLGEPIIVGNTVIGSCGEYGENVGVIKLNINNKATDLVSYELVPINDSVIADKETVSAINDFKTEVTEYLNMFGYESADQIIAYSPYEFPEQNTMSDSLKEQQLGNLISDSYIYAIKEAEGENYTNIDVSIAPVGVIRASIDQGYITVSQVYEISSLGVGNDGVSGYPLCSVYLYGSELWAIAEIDASVSGIMSYAQLYCSGLGYSVNTNRMFMNRVYDCWLIGENGERIEIVEDKLYRVVSGIYSAKMLGSVKEKSFGLLELTPKDKDGNPITDFDNYIVKTDNNVEVKEWKALADYLSSFPEGDNGVPVVPAKYSDTLGRKNIYSYLSVSQIFTNWNHISWIVAVIVLIIIVIVVVLATIVIKKVSKRVKTKMASPESETAD